MQFCFDVDLLKRCSFTGISKNRNVAAKPGFKQYSAISKLIFRVVHKADRSYTMLMHEEFLQIFFKNANSRFTKRNFKHESWETLSNASTESVNSTTFDDTDSD